MVKHKQCSGNKRRFVCLLTPKSYSKIASIKLPQDIVLIKIVPCIEIYMNMLGGWTEEECDNTAYLISEEKFNQTTSLLLQMEGKSI